MKRIRWMAILAILLLLPAGCKKEPEPTVWDGDILVYYLNKEETGLEKEWYTFEEQETTEQITELLAKLRTPSGTGYVATIPESVMQPAIFMGANGLLTLLFDESYSSVTGIREVLTRAAIVKTLCQTDGVDSVEFYVSGQPLMNAQNMPVGRMKETDFIDTTGPEANYYQYLYAKVYYANENGTALQASNLKIPYTGTKSEAEIVLQQLIIGPVTEDMYPAVSDKTEVLSVSIKDNICTVDFNKKFLDKPEGVSEEVVIYSVVNTLAELPGIYQVQFLVEGKQEKLYQKMDLLQPYERNLNVIEKE